MMKSLVIPGVYACGVGMLLFSTNRPTDPPISMSEYTSLLPFWAVIVRPSGLFWNKTVNRSIATILKYPADMKQFKQLYLANNQSVLVEILSNQLAYHVLLGCALTFYLYNVRKYTTSIEPNQDYIGTMKIIGFDLLKTRLSLGLLGIGIDYWSSYNNAKKCIARNTAVVMPEGLKRVLLLKQLVIGLTWYTFCVRKLYSVY